MLHTTCTTSIEYYVCIISQYITMCLTVIITKVATVVLIVKAVVVSIWYIENADI